VVGRRQRDGARQELLAVDEAVRQQCDVAPLGPGVRVVGVPAKEARISSIGLLEPSRPEELVGVGVRSARIGRRQSRRRSIPRAQHREKSGTTDSSPGPPQEPTSTQPPPCRFVHRSPLLVVYRSRGYRSLKPTCDSSDTRFWGFDETNMKKQ
jgi:hypothetical protein